MDWKLFIALVFIATHCIFAHPGVRTPPTELLEKFLNESELPSETNDTKITPLLKDGRYLNETTNSSMARSNGNVIDVELVTNNSSLLVKPSLISRINIFKEYQASTNHIINEFLRKNIAHLLNDSFTRRRSLTGSNHLVKVDNVISRKNESFNDTADDFEMLEKEYKRIRGYFVDEGDQVNDKIDYPTETSYDQYVSQKYTSSPSVFTSFTPTLLPPTHSYFGTSTPSYSQSTSKIPTAVLTDSNFSSIIVKKKKRKPPYYSSHDPADPDPFDEGVPDMVSPILGYDQQESIKNSLSQPAQPELVAVGETRPNTAGCSGVKVILNDKLSFNLSPENGACNNVKVNVNNELEMNRIPNPPKSETTIIAESLGNKTKRKRKRPTKNKTKKKKPSSSLSSDTQSVPLIAHIPAIFETTGAPAKHPYKKKPAKLKKKKHRKDKKWLGKFKGIGGIFMKIFFFFTVINPISFSLWTMLLSPLAVLIAGGASLALILYPLGAALLAPSKHSAGPSHQVVIHRHRHRHRPRRPYKWHRESQEFSHEVPDDWRRSDRHLPMRLEPRTENLSIIDRAEEFLRQAIEKFHGS